MKQSDVFEDLLPWMSRLTRIVRHIRPKIRRETKQTTSIPSGFFHSLFAMQFAGDLKHLTISNATDNMLLFADNPNLQQCLLNTNNDVLNFTQLLCLLQNDVQYEVHGHVCAKDVLQKLVSFLLQINNDNGLILYWSGHGRLNTSGDLHLSFARAEDDNLSERLINLDDIVACAKAHTTGPLLLVLESCYSGTASRLGRYGDKNSVFILSSCKSSELSGAWVMDGEDTSGIMTNFIVDPIATYFKVLFQVFYDFGGDWHSSDNNNKREFYKIFEYYSDLMISEWIDSCTDIASVEAMKWIKENAPHIYTLYRNYLLLVKYGLKLFLPQSPQSFPDLSAIADSSIWVRFESELEAKVIELWDLRLQKI